MYGSAAAKGIGRESFSFPAGAGTVQAADDTADTGVVTRLAKLQRQITTQSLAMLGLIRQMDPVEVKAGSMRIDRAVVMTSSCPVYEIMDMESRVIHHTIIQETMQFLEQRDGLSKVRLPDGREGWVDSRCIQVYTDFEGGYQIHYPGVRNSEIPAYIRTLTEMMNSLAVMKNKTDTILRESAGALTRQDVRIVDSLRVSIDKSFGYAQRFFYQYINNRSADTWYRINLTDRMHARGELSLGYGKYTTLYLANDDAVEGSLSGALRLNGTLDAGPNTKINAGFGQRKEVLKTPFSASELYTELESKINQRFNISTGLYLDTYRDPDIEKNSYNRFSWRNQGEYRISRRDNFRIHYVLLKHLYTEEDSTGYTDHTINAQISRRFDTGDRLLLELRSRLETSESSYHRFSNMAPAITYEGPVRARLSFENHRYEMIDFKSYRRLEAAVDGTVLLGTWNIRSDIAAVVKTYPENNINDYLQIHGRMSMNRRSGATLSLVPSMYTTLFTHLPENSNTDFRMDVTTNGTGIRQSWSLFFKYWHDPGNPDKDQPVKPHSLDFYGRLLFPVQGLFVGPAVGVRAVISRADGFEFLKEDGDVIRTGLHVNGSLPVLDKGRVAFNAMYEYGFVSGTEFEVDEAGEIEWGDYYRRHPVTFQMNLDFSRPVSEIMEVFARVDMHIISTDISAISGRNPVSGNRRFQVLAGIRYIYN
ncbi:hypothetical protein JXO52_09270 [bacterium]|nr:hypothetical protein [bacterium]